MTREYQQNQPTHHRDSPKQSAMLSPGKRTLVEDIFGAPVQRKETGRATADIHEAAQHGTSGPSSQLPHLETIQRLFGRFDVSGIQAHTGDSAQQATRDMGAMGFASGNHVAFASTPDLHTAAHEAAHVVQQRSGVQLKDGVGQANDAYERHADAVADKVVAGQNAEMLLGEMTGGSPSGGDVQRKEVGRDGDIKGTKDWTKADRQGSTSRWKDACLHNLKAVDSSQYVKVVERRDFYKWFYEHTAKLGYTTRWALAAHLVANGAHQIADMDEEHGSANKTLGIANVELQGAMREGNQVIFDNVLPKLKKLLDGGPLKGSKALQWDMQVLAEEQTLIQPMYAHMSSETRKQLDSISRKKGLTGLGAWWYDEDKVSKGDHNKEGRVPGFKENDLQNIKDRWTYGMKLGDMFTPGGTGFDSTHKMPDVSSSYTSGKEFAKVDNRHHLHQLDAWLNPNRKERGESSALQAIISGLSNFEKGQVLTDISPDGWAYSTRFAQLSVPEAQVRQALPGDAKSANAVNAFLVRYHAKAGKSSSGTRR